MLYLRSINRCILISLAMLGLSVSPAKSALVSFNTTFTVPGSSMLDDVPGKDTGNSGTVAASVVIALGPPASFALSNSYTDNWSTVNEPANGSITAGSLSGTNLGSATMVLSWEEGGGAIPPTNALVKPNVPEWDILSFGLFGQLDDGRILNTVDSTPGNAQVKTADPVSGSSAVWLFGTALIGFVGLSRRRDVD